MKNSIVYDVIEALKQLIFPFTFDYLPQIVPANLSEKYKGCENMKDFCLQNMYDSVQPFLIGFATRTPEEDFVAFKTIARAVVLNVEASKVYVSDIKQYDDDCEEPVRDLQPLPPFPDEI